jgi:outer membrane protein, heavy metal efflux system
MNFRDFSVCLMLLSFAGAAHGAEKHTLNQAVSEALEKNAGLLAERVNIAIAEARIFTARLLPNPSVSVTGDHMDILGTGFNDQNGGGPTEIGVGFEYTLVRGGKRPRRVEAAEQVKSVTELQFRNAARALALDVQHAFVDALVANESVNLARQNQGFFRQIVEINETRLKAGDIAQVELIRSRLAALQYTTAVRQAEQRQHEALVKLETLLGRRHSADFAIEGTLDVADTAPLLGDVQKDALDERPDLLALRRDVLRAGSELKLQRANATQDWTLGAEYRRQQYNAKSNSLTLSLSMPLPVYDRNQGEIARADRERHQAELRVKALENNIAGEVETAWTAFMSARGMLETIRGDMLKNARDVRGITEFSYKRGEATLLDLLDAQRAFNDTMQAYNEARGAFARSLYELENARGRVALP